MSKCEEAITNNTFLSKRIKIASFLAMTMLGLISLSSTAQPYTDQTFQPQIKTVQFYNAAKENSLPVITLNSAEQLLLSFDDLSTNSRNFSYTIEHCDAAWNSSRISPTEYLQSFTEDRIMDYRYSVTTLKKYIHYELTLPNRNIAPKLPGNYVLKVYEDGDPNKIVLTQHFYVVSSRASIQAEVVPSANVALRQTNQKVNFQVDFAGMAVQNPYSDIRVLVMQNGRYELGQMNTRPTFIRGSSLVYNDIAINDFPGGNEFRHFDIRSLRLNSEQIGRIFRDTANTVLLLTDQKRGQDNYLFQYDNDGGFFILNQEGRDPKTDADYARVYFNLAASGSSADQEVYLVGKFNNYRTDAQSKMEYDATRGRYYYNALFKQGVYDYEYVMLNSNHQPDISTTEGNHFETQNTYQILVYYRPPGARWEELIGFRQISTVGR
ncbi:DUF5103 domain-containing protein [Mucilaginibacter sp. RS28]|uniref:DUF5103 domain-containing protein n=1 Tax=Mucilaginibacter straminoryzae TaxID=2932774 RepID=A0A9X1X496_9SPHI|nr:DUF5103 domain-containing protein [Mucilaginibacter straminoryzae]MCJ8210080.1 DUF5103 domain-containing protein [Mucilaginibacter straminoryzae]